MNIVNDGTHPEFEGDWKVAIFSFFGGHEAYAGVQFRILWEKKKF